MSFFKEKILKKIIDFYRTTDLVFLIFLILFFNIKLPVKLTAVVFIYTLRMNTKFGLKLNNQSRLPLFYLLMLALGILELFVNFNFNTNYLVLFSSNMFIWVVCLLALHQVKLAIEKNGALKVENALSCFFVLNAFFSLFDLLAIFFETHSLNPYTFEGLSYKYFTSTGDYVRGISFDICTTNMIINALGLFYFLYQKRYLLSLVCLVVVLLTTSNLGNLILIFFFALAYFVNKDKLFRSVILCYLSILVIFMVKVTPSNLSYFVGSYKKLNKTQVSKNLLSANHKQKLNADSLIRLYVALKNLRENPPNPLTKEISDEISNINESKRKIRAKIEILKQDIEFDNIIKNKHSALIEFSRDVYGDSISAQVISRMKSPKSLGKIVSFFQTLDFSTHTAKNFFLGAGPGNFSSKFTFRALGLGTDGQWPKRYIYRSADFTNNHLKLWLYYQLQPPAEHSTLNAPNSVANQLLGEYGFVGVLLFLVFYLWYFLKRYKYLTYGRIILPLMMVFLMTDYWFENLSVMIIFEAMILLDLQKKVLPA